MKKDGDAQKENTALERASETRRRAGRRRESLCLTILFHATTLCTFSSFASESLSLGTIQPPPPLKGSRLHSPHRCVRLHNTPPCCVRLSLLCVSGLYLHLSYLNVYPSVWIRLVPGTARPPILGLFALGLRGLRSPSYSQIRYTPA